MQAGHPDPELDRERSKLEITLERWLEWPMILLAVVWLVLLVIELIHGVSPQVERLGLLIWVVFIAEFVLRLTIATHKLRFLKRNWFTALTLLLPALRVFRVQ